MKKIFWIAGENSSDLHASFVIKVLNKRDIKLQHFGIGGPEMQANGFDAIFPFEKFSVMGFLEVLKHLFFYINVEKQIKKLFFSSKPDLVVLVDYPGLNMRIAKLAKSFGIPVLYFICPQFWAWKKNRLLKLKKFTDHISFILPFEKKYLDEYKIPSTYVGHPIAEEIVIGFNKKDFAEKYNLDLNKKWLGFLPGSRNNEIRKILPEYLKAIKKFDPAQYEVLISKATTISDILFHNIISSYDLPKISFIKNDNYSLMKHCDFIVAKSGTSSLETAYIGTPFIIVYKTSKISYEIGKRFITINRIGLPNIILDKDLAPELIQDKANAENIYFNVTDILNSKEKCKTFHNELKKLHSILGNKSASEGTANIIEDLINE